MSRAKSLPPEIDEDRPFQERFWRVERAAWVVFTALVLAALAGLFGGGGPLSRGSAVAGDSVIDYPGIARWQAGEEFSIQLAGTGARRVALSPDFAAAFEINDIQPTPVRVEASGTGHSYVFAAQGNAPVDIQIAITPHHPGVVTYSVAPGSAAPVRLTTVVWP